MVLEETDYEGELGNHSSLKLAVKYEFNFPIFIELTIKNSDNGLDGRNSSF